MPPVTASPAVEAASRREWRMLTHVGFPVLLLLALLAASMPYHGDVADRAFPALGVAPPLRVTVHTQATQRFAERFAARMGAVVGGTIVVEDWNGAVADVHAGRAALAEAVATRLMAPAAVVRAAGDERGAVERRLRALLRLYRSDIAGHAAFATPLLPSSSTQTGRAAPCAVLLNYGDRPGGRIERLVGQPVSSPAFPPWLDQEFVARHEIMHCGDLIVGLNHGRVPRTGGWEHVPMAVGLATGRTPNWSLLESMAAETFADVGALLSLYRDHPAERDLVLAYGTAASDARALGTGVLSHTRSHYTVRGLDVALALLRDPAAAARVAALDDRALLALQQLITHRHGVDGGDGLDGFAPHTLPGLGISGAPFSLAAIVAPWDWLLADGGARLAALGYPQAYAARLALAFRRTVRAAPADGDAQALGFAAAVPPAALAALLAEAEASGRAMPDAAGLDALAWTPPEPRKPAAGTD